MDDPGAQRKTRELEMMKLLQSGIASLYQDKLLCDVQLEAEGKIFSAHRTILSAVTDYFRGMFTRGFKESKQTDKPIVMEGVSAVGLGLILDFIYTTELKLTPESILETIPIACMLQIQPLIAKCEEFLISSVCTDKCLIYGEIAERFHLKTAMDCFAEYKKAHFLEISQTLVFKELDLAEVVSYLSLPDLFLNGIELTALDAAIAWLEHKPQERQIHVLDIFRCINLLQIPASDITEKVSKVPMIKGNIECEALVQESLKYHRDVFTQPFYDGKIVNTRGVKDGIIVLPYYFDSADCPDYGDIFGDLDSGIPFFRYIPIEEKNGHRSVDKFIQGSCRPRAEYVTSRKPEPFENDDLVKVGNFLFIFNDPGNGKEKRKLLRYNPMLDDWVRLAPVPRHTCRTLYSVSQCSEKHIMLLGKNSNTSTFYFIYSIVDDEWTKGKAHIETDSWFLHSAYHNGRLYLAYGKTLLSYNMENDAWSHECKFPWEGCQESCELVGHKKVCSSCHLLVTLLDSSIIWRQKVLLCFRTQ